MKTIYKSDLGSSASSLNEIEPISTKITDLKSSIDSFCEDSVNKLKGDGYDAVRTDVILYSRDLNVLKSQMTELADKGRTVNNNMINYLTPEIDYIDDTYASELKASYNRAISLYNKIILEKASLKDDIQPNDNRQFRVDRIYKNMKKLESKIKIVDGLEGKDNSEFAKVEDLAKETQLSHVNRLAFTSLLSGYNLDRLNWKGVEALSSVYKYLSNMDVSQERKDFIIEALSYLGLGIKYSQRRRNLVDENGTPLYLDCSSYVSRVLRGIFPEVEEEGITDRAWTRTFKTSDLFEHINRNDIEPGDLIMQYGGGTRHIGIYLGKDENGKSVYIHCFGRGDGIKVATVGSISNYNITLRYNQLD